jgi:glycosyltransferase involved in cell wall biosynthesis
MNLRVCLTSIELFPDGVHGGFGRATRAIGRALAERGVTVTVVMPRRSDDRPDEYALDGMSVRQFAPWKPWQAIRQYRAADADVYHSEDTSIGTRLAMAAMPDRAHAITFRDPLEDRDWEIETAYSSNGGVGWRLYRHFVDGPIVASAIPRAQGCYCAAEHLRAKVARKYAVTPAFLPTPVDVPEMVRKASRPTACYVGRWDGRKRPERFFELARDFPDVQFVAVGSARDPARDSELRQTYGRLPNLEMPGFIDQFRTDALWRILERSWILVNTSPREGLPNTFLEGCAHRCAILSFVDPDGFASKFGYAASDEGLRAGLEWLLAGDRWREQGERGHAFVRAAFATPVAVDAHLAAYQELLATPRRAK